ncbi:carbohydrate sulfotransferase 5-like [Panulirus ornatus]|uniref:carbohydrate sulfotransferase 5-like n=1 Tax=Panulirus ornatus TaxID=150431 RepID=UPI003A870C92
MMTWVWKMVLRKKRLMTLLLLLPLLFAVNFFQSINFTTINSWSQREAEMYTERDRNVWSEKNTQILSRKVVRLIDVQEFEPEGDTVDFEAGPQHRNERLQIKQYESNGMNENKESSHVGNKLSERREQDHQYYKDTVESRDSGRQKERFELVMGNENENSEQDPNGRDGQEVREVKFDIVMSVPNESMVENYGKYQERGEIIDYEEEENFKKETYKEEGDDGREKRNPETENETEKPDVETASVDYITLRNRQGQLPPRTTSPTSMNQSIEETLEILKERISLPDQGNISRKAPPSNVLLLSSIGRSGSSFLGSLLSSQPGSFYFFEPLHNLEKRKILTEENAVQGLRALFTCNIDGLILEALKRKSRFTIRNQYIKTCKRKCFISNLLNSACRNKPIRVVKTIRMQVAWLLPLLEDPASNVKMIHLVRDPRASLISAWKEKWDITPEKSCSRISQDLQSGRNLNKLYPERYLTVRYEDLCGDPWGMARIIFSYLGYTDLPSSTISFLKTSITSNTSGSPYSIKRNSYLMKQNWRTIITQKQLTDIEQVCASTIQDIGFGLFHDLNTVKNLSVPLYLPSPPSKFFFYNKVA